MPDPVTSFVEHALESGELSPGGRLPTERALAESLALPRSAVRRALAGLERNGRIVRQVGRGTFVAEVPFAEPDGELMTSPAEIMDTRLMIEPQIAIHAAQTATPSDLAHIAMCMNKGNACESYDDFEAWDSKFHRAIAASVHNGLLLKMFDAMNAARELPFWGSSKRRAATPDRRRAYEGQHDAIYRALLERDSGAARAAMTLHLESVRTNLLNPPT